MLSDKITEFERNRFFFGKLLTADDFQSEQAYFNNKRRLLNRLVLGTGVVCGMSVIKTDDNSIAVESGLALDFGGREIIINEAIVSKLSDIDGFELPDNCTGKKMQSIYLCAEYFEEQIEPVHSLARNVFLDESEGAEFNKIRETCNLFIKTGEPQTHPSEVYCATKIYIPIFGGDGVSVNLSAPRFVDANEEFYLETHIKKGFIEQNTELKCEIDLAFLSSNGKHTAKISFDENENKQLEHVVRIPVRAASVCDAVAKLTLKNFEITINDSKYKLSEEKSAEIIISTNKVETAVRVAREKNLDDSLEVEQDLYLARINLVLTADNYVIDSVESLPFGQSVPNFAQVQSLRNRDLPAAKTSTEPRTIDCTDGVKMNTGRISVAIPGKAAKGGKYYSKAVPHFLGVGEVLVTAALSGKGNSIFGDGIFDDSVEWSVRADKERGIFTVGVRLKKSINSGELVFDWFALKKEAQKSMPAKTLTLFPDVYYATAHETIAFEPKLSEGKLKSGDLVWSVVPQEGGNITKSGVFTASNKAGFYEVVAQSRDGRLSASAFVVV